MLPMLPCVGDAQGLGAYAPRLEIETVSPAWQPRAMSTSTDAAALASLSSQGHREAIRARWWWGSGRIEVGAGADWTMRAMPQSTIVERDSATPVLGLRAELAQGAHLAYERDAVVASRHNGVSAASGDSRLALELSAGGARPARALPAGLLRLQLSSASTLQLRPRSGGLPVTYRAKF